MRKTVKGFSIGAIVIGALAIIGSVEPYSGYGLLGGVMFGGYGVLVLSYLGTWKETKPKVE